MTMPANNEPHGFDLEITQMARVAATPGAIRVRGTADGHRFEALVLPAHAARPGAEMGRTRIGRLMVRRLRDRRVAFLFDAGRRVPAIDPRAAELVEFLGRQLAPRVDRALAARVGIRPNTAERPAGREFATAAEAVRYAREHRPVAITINGRNRVVAQAEASRLEAAGVEFAFLTEVDGRVVTVPVNG
jgi:hypothetical protein